MNLPPYQCALVRAWNFFSSRLPGDGSSLDLTSKSLMESACLKAGNVSFENTDFEEGLDKFLRSVASSGNLHSFGRFFVKQFVSGLLVNRLRLEGLWRKHPEILEKPVTSPIIILGLPRSGTSFLFNLLAQDPAHRVLTNWEVTVSQVPPEGRYNFQTDPRRTQAKRLFRFQKYLAPQMQAMHEFYLDGPEECTPLLMQDFNTLALALMFNVPEYYDWVASASQSETYAQHYRILQTLQWKYPGKRWLLKSPSHVSIQDILAVYDDACIIQMHRDPTRSVASAASLSGAFRGIHSSFVNAEELGDQTLNVLGNELERYLVQRERCDSERFIDFQYSDLITDPVNILALAYRHFQIPFSDDAEACMRAFLVRDREKARVHRYRPEDFGLTADLIRSRFGDYIKQFDIPFES